jgi:hypothetical protein
MRAPIVIFLAAFMLVGCCGAGYPVVVWSPNPPPFDAFQAGMRLAVGMPLDVAILAIGSAPVSGEVKSCGIAAGYEWPCEVVKFGCCENNQLLVYVALTPDGRGAVNSWAVRKG